MRKVNCLWLIFLPLGSGLAQTGASPRVGPIPPISVQGSGARSNPRAGFGRSLAPFAYPFYFGDYDYSYSGYAPAPSVVIVQQPPPAYLLVPQVPAQTPLLEIHEYALPGSSPVPAPDEEPATFAIVLKDGSVRSAVAVAVQNNTLHFVEPDGTHSRVSLQAVDRDATRRRNREHKLELQLPAPDR